MCVVVCELCKYKYLPPPLVICTVATEVFLVLLLPPPLQLHLHDFYGMLIAARNPASKIEGFVKVLGLFRTLYKHTISSC